MTIDLTDDRGTFTIDLGDDESQLAEIDILRMQAAAGMRTATFLKESLGTETVLELIKDRVDAAHQRWKEYVTAAEGRFAGHSTRYHVVGMSAEEFYDYIAAHGGQSLQFQMHPEHYVSDFSAGLGGRAVIAEPWGSAMILSHAAFGDPDELRAEGIDVGEIWEPDALYRVCAVGRWPDGTFLSAIMHQILPPDISEADGQPSFVFKTGGFMPVGVPEEILAGCREHGLVEFTNMVRIARDAVVANRN